MSVAAGEDKQQLCLYWVGIQVSSLVGCGVLFYLFFADDDVRDVLNPRPGDQAEEGGYSWAQL